MSEKLGAASKVPSESCHNQHFLLHSPTVSFSLIPCHHLQHTAALHYSVSCHRLRLYVSGFYSPNLSSKNVLDSFFKLIGILLILPGTAPASLFSANFPEYRLGSLPFCSCCSLSAPLTKATLISWFLPEGWDFCLI